MFKVGRRTCPWQNPWIRLVCPSLTSRPAGRRSSGAIVCETPWFVQVSGTKRTRLQHARSGRGLGDNLEGEGENYFLKMFPFPPPFSSGRLWRPPAVPAGAGSLGGARRGELRAHRLHRGEQTQRVHPHGRLHPLDRGDAHQRLLPALSSDLAPVCLMSDVQRRPQTHSSFILRQQVHHFWNSEM